MILATLFFLLSFSLALAYIGYKTEVPIIQIAGYAFIFLLALDMSWNGIEQVTGETVTYSYNASAVITSTTATDIYTTLSNYNTRTIGFYLGLVSVICVVGVLFDMKMPRRLEP